VLNFFSPSGVEREEIIKLADSLLADLFPLCRSISGKGLRDSFAILQKHFPLDIYEVKSGTEIFDWTVPDEWNIRNAYIKDSSGNKVVEFSNSNLHVVSYSKPVNEKMTLKELKPYLHTLPDQPDAIPYVTSYYSKSWGFCLTHRQFETLEEGIYEVVIDSTLEPGSLTYGELLLPGDTEEEVLISSYLCHPSMANNELSGPILSLLLYLQLSRMNNRHYTYRFYLGPETIGALIYLEKLQEHFKNNLKAGLVATCCGDSGKFHYKKVRRKDNILDKAVIHSLRHGDYSFSEREFFPTGSDERQYCSPGFNLPVGSIVRSFYGEYPEYHTSLDNLDFVKGEFLFETLKVYLNALYTLEHNRLYINTKPYGEPFLSKYDLQDTLGAVKEHSLDKLQLKYLLNFSDGSFDLIDIAEMLSIPLWELEPTINKLKEAGLLELAA
jgi:aminopeptidase-like protein